MIQLTLTLKMTTAQVVETSVSVNNNSPIQDYVHPDHQTEPTFKSFSWSAALCITIEPFHMRLSAILVSQNNETAAL